MKRKAPFLFLIKRMPYLDRNMPSRVFYSSIASIGIYDIHHWSIFWSTHRKLAWVGFAPMTIKFCSEAQTNGVIRPWVQLALRTNFVQLLQFYRLFSATFHLGYYLYIIIYIYIYNYYIYNYYIYLFIYIFLLVLLLVSSFQIYNLELARRFVLTLKY